MVPGTQNIRHTTADSTSPRQHAKPTTLHSVPASAAGGAAAAASSACCRYSCQRPADAVDAHNTASSAAAAALRLSVHRFTRPLTRCKMLRGGHPSGGSGAGTAPWPARQTPTHTKGRGQEELMHGVWLSNCLPSCDTVTPPVLHPPVIPPCPCRPCRIHLQSPLCSVMTSPPPLPAWPSCAALRLSNRVFSLSLPSSHAPYPPIE
jgi:hypothetical protein